MPYILLAIIIGLIIIFFFKTDVFGQDLNEDPELFSTENTSIIMFVTDWNNIKINIIEKITLIFLFTFTTVF